MSLAKSPLGRHLLLNGLVGLTDVERQLLTGVNGSRTRQELFAITGVDSEALVDRMITHGLLVEFPTLPPLLWPDPSSVQWAATQDVVAQDSSRPELATRLEAPANTPGLPVALTAKVSKARGKRSVVATKMYTVNMLNLVRSPDSAAHLSAVQGSVDEDEMMLHVLSAMQYFISKATPSYAAKVMSHLQEVVPVEYLEQLDQLIFQTLMADAKLDSPVVAATNPPIENLDWKLG
jgi:hypothetical protein